MIVSRDCGDDWDVWDGTMRLSCDCETVETDKVSVIVWGQDEDDTSVCRHSRETAYDTDWVRQALDAGEKVSVTVGGQDGVDTAVAGRIGRLSHVFLMVARRELETNWWFTISLESEEESEEEEEMDSE